MKILSAFACVLCSILLEPATAEPRSAGRVSVLDGSEVLLISIVAREAGIPAKTLPCYDVTVVRESGAINVGFSPKITIDTRDGVIRSTRRTDCEAHSFLVSQKGKIIRRILIRDH